MSADAYDDLLARYERVANLGHAAGVLGWDQQVMMPDGGTPARAEQLSTLSTVRHEALTSDGLSRAIDGAGNEELDDEERAVVREVRRQHERAASVPSDLVEELARTRAEATRTWREAKRADDFAAFAPTLSRLRELQVERAEQIDPEKSPFEVMYEDAQPCLPLAEVESVFDRLREGLVPMIEAIRESDDLASPWEGSYDEATQMALSRDALDLLGYDWDRGRLDTAPHPFMAGNQFDGRITTRFRDGDPIDALTATIHEFGHATYQLGLRRDAYSNPLGEPRSSGVHESQSRFWENHVGRTRAFWELFLPIFEDRFPRHEDLDVETVYEAVNRVDPDNLIRVEADELTYHLHVLLRCEIGRAFVEGKIEVDEIPGLWNDRMEEYLGVRPETDSEGCLQDIHWSSRFAAFHGYTIGSLISAQVDAAIREEYDVDSLVREGEFGPIHDWLTERVHRHGCRYETSELVRVATGQEFGSEAFLSYAEEKFGGLYGL
ncbi:carboxypeptidase M32 [Natronorarus salvus]|uniref:carboxypeptidase M32 n=1 Tax=Natronorarus salvus TaxID=3117733 RepID=UPI002F269ACB